MSKEVITVYKCDRCGKQMDSPYAILTLKHAGCNLDNDSYINKDLCAGCYDKISFLFNNKNANVYDTTSSGVSTSPVTVPDIPMKHVKVPDVSPLERGTYVTGTGNDPLNKHLNVTCI